VYGKVFDSIYDGTLYGHWEAIVTMQQLIVLSTADGVVDMTPQAIAARTSIPLDIITKGLKVLSEPDPYTRTPGEDGRRIVLLDTHRPWGWKLVNHGKYSRLRNMEQKREADRLRMEENRSKNSDVATGSRRVAKVAHADADIDKDEKKGARARRTALPEGFAISENVRTWAVKKGFAGQLEQHFEYFLAHAKANARTYVDWDAAFMNCVRGDWGGIRRQAQVADRAAGRGAHWALSDDGIRAKAKELGLTLRAGESWQDLKGRINAAIARTPAEARA
jgi:hypothetical protein